jgi:predicted DNA-binding transcriptional regulator AlpA
MSALLNEKEVAQLLKMSLPTLRRWRAAKTGPRFLKIVSVRESPREGPLFIQIERKINQR